MKYSEAENRMRKQLETVYGNEESVAMANLTLEHLTGLSRGQRMMQKEASLNIEQEESLKNITQRLMQQEPLQYVLGEVYFCGLKLFVDKNVLIPRPETEELVQWIIGDVKEGGKNVFEQKKGEADATDLLKILDVGTGSGCIALALKNKMPKAEVWGCDTSDAGLNIARRNGSLLDIRVDFVGLNFLDPLQRKQLPTVDIIVSNPPYIPLKDKDSLQPNVVQHEPHLALFVPDDDSLIFYKALAAFGKERLYPNGKIYAEINEDLAKEVRQLFEQSGYQKIEIKKDMQGKDRMLKAVINIE